MPSPQTFQFGGALFVGPTNLPATDGAILTGDTNGVTGFASIASLDASVLPTTDPLNLGRLYRNGTGQVFVSLGTSPYSPAIDFSESRNSQYLTVV